MPTTIEWKIDKKLAALHLAYCRDHHLSKILPSDSRIPDKKPPLPGGTSPLSDIEQFWAAIMTVASDRSSNFDMARHLLQLCLAPECLSDRPIEDLAAWIAEAEIELDSTYPKFFEEMKLRMRPLQEQWEAYGPGLLYQTQRFLYLDHSVNSAEVFLVPPVAGGMGRVHLNTNRCHIEALLTNIASDLPEALRLAWLLTQLGIYQSAEYQDARAKPIGTAVGLAALPAALMAGEQLGICNFDVHSIRNAVKLWGLESKGPKSEVLSDILLNWWQKSSDGKIEWSAVAEELRRIAGADQRI